MTDNRDQCGLLPLNHPTLWESMTGRQRWGGFARCPYQGACAACPITARHLAGEPIDVPGDAPVLLARITPWKRDPNALFADPGAGRSDVCLTHWTAGAPGPAVSASWDQIRNWREARLGRAFRDEHGSAFWLVRDRPGNAAADTTRHRDHTVHTLRTGDEGATVAQLRCPANCRHQPMDLELLAADLDRASSGTRHVSTLDVPATLPGIPGTRFTFTARASTMAIHRHDATTSVTLGHPANPGSHAALVAHAVRVTST
jgi:hypothetical protein